MSKTIMYEQIYQDLLEKIRKKEYRAGDRLPSEKELAATYGVSRITTKKSMDLLAERQYITRTPGRGSFVNELIEHMLTQESGQLPLPVGASSEREKIIAVIFDCFGSDFGSELLKSIEQECRRKHYNMLFKCSYGSIERENEAIGSALDLGAEGIILMCAQGEVYNNTVLRLALNGFPLVLVDRQMKGISIPCVKTDNYSAAHELTEILLKKGHKKLCFVSHAELNTTTINERYKGFAECVMEYQDASGVFAKVESYDPAPEDLDKEYKKFDFEELDRLLELNQDCTAFLAAEYKLAVLLSRAIKRRGMHKEKEIAAFDALEPAYDEENHFIHAKQDRKSVV